MWNFLSLGLDRPGKRPERCSRPNSHGGCSGRCEVCDTDFAPLPEDPTGCLYALAHTWAADTTAPVIIRAQNVDDLTVAVATST
jgi:hypothetical protein